MCDLKKAMGGKRPPLRAPMVSGASRRDLSGLTVFRGFRRRFSNSVVFIFAILM